MDQGLSVLQGELRSNGYETGMTHDDVNGGYMLESSYNPDDTQLYYIHRSKKNNWVVRSADGSQKLFGRGLKTVEDVVRVLEKNNIKKG